jgi:hypothetical protein
MRDLAAWPAIAAYCARIKQDPSVARAMTDENALFAAKQQRNKSRRLLRGQSAKAQAFGVPPRIIRTSPRNEKGS